MNNVETKINDYLKHLKRTFNLNIINNCKDDIILFDFPVITQQFKFKIQIEFNGIVGQESFVMNIPSLYINEDNMTEFKMTIILITNIIMDLNQLIIEYKKEKNIK